MVMILMAAYNGEKYIAEQIESILSQTETDWKLVIQDDCSKDKTVEIIKKYVKKCPGKIFLVELKAPFCNAKSNFSAMLGFADTDYMMTCDQDDVWLPDKIKSTLEKMHELEEGFGHCKPLLVHTDLKVVNEKLNMISDSMFVRQNLNSSRDKFNNLLVQNIVTGCTMMVNSALLNLVYEVPEQAIMHDWWLALIAAAFGHIGFINEPTVLYRQHDSNAVGSKNATGFYYNLNRMISRKQSQLAIRETYTQAKSFLKTYESQLSVQLLKLVKEYSYLPQYKKIKRLQTIWKYDFWKTGFFRRCGQILFM